MHLGDWEVLLAHYLEGRIDRLLRNMEELFQEILPRFEQFEGKIRVQRAGTKGQKNNRPPRDASTAASPPHMEERPPIQPSVMRDAIERPNELTSGEPSMEAADRIDAIEDAQEGQAASMPTDSANGEKGTAGGDGRSS